MDNEDFLWAGTAFRGGIAGQPQGPCGAVSAAAIALGLRHRCPLHDEDRAERARKAANDDAAELVRSFHQKFGAITCFGLLGVDFSDEEAMKRAIESGMFKKCDNHVQFVIEKLYELDKKRSAEKKK